MEFKLHHNGQIQPFCCCSLNSPMFKGRGGVINFENFATHMSQIGNNKSIFKKWFKKVPANGFEKISGLKFYSILVSSTTKFYSFLVSPTTKFYFI